MLQWCYILCYIIEAVLAVGEEIGLLLLYYCSNVYIYMIVSKIIMCVMCVIGVLYRGLCIF